MNVMLRKMRLEDAFERYERLRAKRIDTRARLLPDEATEAPASDEHEADPSRRKLLQTIAAILCCGCVSVDLATASQHKTVD